MVKIGCGGVSDDDHIQNHIHKTLNLESVIENYSSNKKPKQKPSFLSRDPVGLPNCTTSLLLRWLTYLEHVIQLHRNMLFLGVRF